MCTSFVHRGQQMIIGMNFDNDGSPWKMVTSDPKWFLVKVQSEGCWQTSFGIRHDGLFLNSLVAPAVPKGAYRRGKSIVHMTKLLDGIVSGTVAPDAIGDYLAQTTIVNVPNRSVHAMIVAPDGETWIVEPGIGTAHYDISSARSVVMTNHSLGTADQCPRYMTVSEALADANQLSTRYALNILESIAQRSGEWTTSLSFVYESGSQEVRYVIPGDGDETVYRFGA